MLLGLVSANLKAIWIPLNEKEGYPMASPCCPKCGHKQFLRSKDASINTFLIYCSHCGAILGALPLGFKSSKSSSTSTGTTSSTGTSSSATSTGGWNRVSNTDDVSSVL